jgi:hypothetical protein
VNTRARLARLEAAVLRTQAAEPRPVYIVPSWALPRTKDGGGHEDGKDVIFIMPRPSGVAGRGKI